MRALTKLGCLVICLTLLMGSLASCDLLEQYLNQSVDPDKYVAKVRIVFATNDEKMMDAVASMSSTATINADGDNISVQTSAEIGNSSVRNTYTVVDEMLYHKLLIISDAFSAESLKCAAFGDQDKEYVLSKIGVKADVGLEDFDSSEMYSDSGIDTYECSDITDEAREGLEDIIADDFDSLGASVNIKDVYYIVEMKGNLEVGNTLSCSFEISLNGKVYEVTMHIYTDYDYTANPKISVPENFDDYTEVSLDEIIK